MKRKLVAILLCLSIIGLTTACGSNKDNTTSKNSEITSENDNVISQKEEVESQYSEDTSQEETSELTSQTTESQGECGDNATWSYKDHVLVIKGTGTINNPLWQEDENVNNNIHSVVIENGITEIGDYTFCYTGNLEEIAIPNSVTSIGRGAFEGCSGLKKITIPDSVTSIERGAFMGCSDNLEIIYNGSAEGYPWKTNISER